MIRTGQISVRYLRLPGKRAVVSPEDKFQDPLIGDWCTDREQRGRTRGEACENTELTVLHTAYHAHVLHTTVKPAFCLVQQPGSGALKFAVIDDRMRDDTERDRVADLSGLEPARCRLDDIGE